jgi:hypothetical protein
MYTYIYGMRCRPVRQRQELAAPRDLRPVDGQLRRGESEDAHAHTQTHTHARTQAHTHTQTRARKRTHTLAGVLPRHADVLHAAKALSDCGVLALVLVVLEHLLA